MNGIDRAVRVSEGLERAVEGLGGADVEIRLYGYVSAGEEVPVTMTVDLEVRTDG